MHLLRRAFHPAAPRRHRDIYLKLTVHRPHDRGCPNPAGTLFLMSALLASIGPRGRKGSSRGWGPSCRARLAGSRSAAASHLMTLWGPASDLPPPPPLPRGPRRNRQRGALGHLIHVSEIIKSFGNTLQKGKFINFHYYSIKHYYIYIYIYIYI